jgi:hypothetical protein
MPSFSTSISGIGSRRISSSIRLDMRMMLFDGVDRVYGDVDGTRLVSDAPGNRLAAGSHRLRTCSCDRTRTCRPPIRPIIALLDEVEELQVAVGGFLGSRDDETRVCGRHLHRQRLAIGGISRPRLVSLTCEHVDLVACSTSPP